MSARFTGTVNARANLKRDYRHIVTSDVATATGAALNFTDIPSWVSSIRVIMDALSLTGTGEILVQVGDSGGIATDNYTSASSAGTTAASSVAGFIVKIGVAARSLHGLLDISHKGGNVWISSHSAADTSPSGVLGGGRRDTALSGSLDRVRVTMTSTSTNEFDTGTVSLQYQ